MTCGDDPEDVGQQELLMAFDSQLDFNFKVTLNDALTISGEPTVQYFRGKIMSKRRNIGTVDNIVRRTFTIGINSPIYEVAAT
jgi:hypothetical protein